MYLCVRTVFLNYYELPVYCTQSRRRRGNHCIFNDDATQEQIDNIGAQLKKQDGVKEIKYVSADEAWETFKDQYFGESSDLAEGFKMIILWQDLTTMKYI